MRPRRLHARALFVLLIVFTALALAVAAGVADGPRSAGAAAGPPGSEIAREADDLARAAAAPWPALQQPAGTFRDYVIATRGPRDTQDQYGTEMLGYALLDRGLQDGNRPEVTSGLQAIAETLNRPVESQTAVFETVALASAYNLAAARLAGDPAFERLRGQWESWLTHVTLHAIDRTNRPYYNWNLVESVAIAELLDSHLQSTTAGAVLSDPAGALATVGRILGSRMPAAARASTTASAAGQLTLLSDPPLDPLAYHAFSAGLLARVSERLGPATPSPVPAVLGPVARASWALMSPSGAVSYMGRSQDEAWVQAMTAYGAAAAAVAPGTSSADQARDLAVAQRALDRLRSDYLGGPYGVWINPAMRTNLVQGVRGLDAYATATGYSALTVIALDWAARVLARANASAGTIGSDGVGAFHVGRGPGALVTVRVPKVWFAVRQTVAEHTLPGAGAIDYFGDLRYDSGLSAVETLTAGGWRSFLPERPLTRKLPDSAGPRLILGGTASVPYGDALTVSAAGAVTLHERFRIGGRFVARATDVRFVPLACGVRIVIPARAGERWEYSAFFAGAPRQVAGRELSDGTQTVTFSASARISRTRGYASGTDPALTRVRLRFAPSHGQALTIDECHA